MLAVKPPREMENSAAGVSAAQITANRANAQHSTGPKSSEGKARVARNALRHGLFARNVVGLLNPEPEREAEFAELLEDLMADCEPEGRREIDMVERIAALTWRLADLQAVIQINLTPKVADDVFRYEGIPTAETVGRMEARLSRELSKVQRDLAFHQRYKLGFADQVNAHRHRVAKRELAEFEAESERQMQALSQVPGDGDEGTEMDETIDEGVAETTAREPLFRARTEANQSTKYETEEQTQSVHAEGPPRLRNRSIDLT